MHYKNGREAKVGDLVRGRGYNLHHEFTGVLIEAKPEAASCNFTVVTAVQKPFASDHVGDPEKFMTREYGQLDALVAIDPATGEVLPPEEPKAAESVATPAPATGEVHS